PESTVMPSKPKKQAPPAVVYPTHAELEQRTRDLNLAVLRRHYPGIMAIKHTAAYMELYNVNRDTGQWEKGEIAGPVFVCRLEPTSHRPCRFSVVILSRMGLNNFEWNISGDDDMEIEGEFIILSRGDGHAGYGLWVWEPPSTANVRSNTAAAIQDAIDSVREATQLQPPQSARHAVPSQPTGHQVSLLELFGQGTGQHARDASQYAQEGGPATNDVLAQLFTKAKQDYEATGS
ncbi:PH domain-like protein, partial [Westerdykella ornata]